MNSNNAAHVQVRYALLDLGYEIDDYVGGSIRILPKTAHKEEQNNTTTDDVVSCPQRRLVNDRIQSRNQS